MFKKSFLVMLLFAMVFNTIGVSAEGTNNEKVEFNQLGLIDKIEISPDDLWYGEHTKVTVHFSEKSNHKLSGNSIVTLDYPEDLDVFGVAKDDPLNLEYNGTIIGIVYTDDANQKLIMEFNENVENAYEHKGSFYVTARATFKDPKATPDLLQVMDHETSMGSDAPLTPYKIKYQYRVGSSPFFYKPGGSIWPSSPNHVAWSLNINRDKALFLSDVLITDTIHRGQKFSLIDESLPLSIDNLDPTYFSISIETDDDSKNISVQEFIDGGYGTFKFLSDETFELFIDQQAALPNNKYTLSYRTKITPEGRYQDKFYNDAIAIYTEDGEQVIKEDLDREASNISSGGIIAPEKGSLKIIKLAKHNDETELLGKATFKLYYEDGTEVLSGSDSGVFETNASGQVTTPALDPGKYYVTELSAPDFVDFDPSIKYPFEIKLDDKTGVQLIISNEVKKTSINVEKVWDDILDTHPNITVKLLANGVEIKDVELTDSKLTHVFENLPKYSVAGDLIEYTVQEVPVEGYTSEISGDVDNGFVITNTVIKEDGVLEAFKRVSKADVRQGEEFEYTILVNNNKEDSKELTNVVVSDTLPEGISFVDDKVYVNGTQSDATVTGNSFTLTLPRVAFNDMHEITFMVKADAGVSGERINKAIVTNPEDPENPIEPEVPVTVIPPGEIDAKKFVSKDEVRPLEVFTYTILVENIIENSDDVLNVQIEDTLPEGIVFANDRILVNGVSSNDAVITGQSFKLVLDKLAYNQAVEIRFEVMAEAGVFGTRINKATITDPEDPDHPKEPEVPVVITPKAEIEAEKLVSKDIVKPLEAFTYTIKVSNVTEGSKAIKDVLVKDILPEGLSFVDGVVKVNGVEKNVTIADNSLELTLDSLAYGAPAEITFDVKADANTFGEKINTATIINPEDPENPEEPEVPVTVVPDGKLHAEKRVSKDEVKPTEVFEYSIVVSNIVEGSNALKQVVVKDVLPEGLEFATGEIFVDGVKTPTIVLNNSISVTLKEVAFGKEVVISFLVSAKEGVFGEFVNKAVVTNPEDPENPEEPEVPVTVTPDGSVRALKEVSKEIVKPLESFAYTITVENTVEGSKPLVGIEVTDVLPEGLEFADETITVNSDKVVSSIDQNTLTAVISELAYGEKISITFNVRALSETVGTKINKAIVTNPEDPENPEEPEVPVTVIPDGKLEAEKLVNKNSVKPEEHFTYTILVKNTVKGSNPFKNVEVSDVLPEGLVFADTKITVDGVSQENVIQDNSFAITLEEVSYGKDIEISFEVYALKEVFGERINVATITDPEDPEHPLEPEVPVTITPLGAMAAVKEVSKEVVKPDESFEYEITVYNTVPGSNPLKNVVVKDVLPEGIKFVDKVIKVNGNVVDATVSDNSFELVLDELKYGEYFAIRFTVVAEDVAGVLINKATVTNPEDPENPEEPEVPVLVEPDGVLEAAKLVSLDEVKPLQEFEYTIVVKNTKQGSKALKDIVVEDILPKGLELVKQEVYVDGLLSDSAVVTNNSFKVVVDTVSYGEEVSVTVRVKALEGEFGERLNVAKVTNPEDPQNPEEPEVPVTVVPNADISAEKIVSKDVVKPEETFTYSIIVKNIVEGSKPLANVAVKDILPEDLEFVDGIIRVDNQVSNATVTDNKFELILDELAYGNEKVVSFDVKAKAGSFGERINIATIINPEDPDHPHEPEVPVEIIPEGRIAADKKVNKDEVEPNEAFEYTIIVKNIVEGSKPLKNVKVVDKLPEGLRYVNKEIFVDGVKKPVIVLDDSFEVIIPSLAYGQEVKVTFLAQALEGVFGEKLNIATITDPEDPENPEEPEVPVDVVPEGAISAEKLVSKAEVKPEETFTYTIIVKNTVEGSDPLENVSVKDILPQGIVFTDSIVKVNGVEASATVTDNSFEVILAELEFGKDVSITFDVKALDGEFGERINIAKITNPEDPENPEEPEVPVTIVPDGKISAEKLVSKSEVKPHEEFTYTIVVKNTVEGSKALEGVIVKDTLPKGINFTENIIYVNGVATTAVINNQSFEIVLDNLEYGNNIEVSFKVKAIENKYNESINIATVTNPEDPDNPEEPEVPVTIVPDGVISSQKLVSKTDVKPEEEFVYTIRVNNTMEGSKPVRNVLVKDVLPEGLEFIDGEIYVNNVVVVSATGNSFELTLDSVHYNDSIDISFRVKALKGEFGEKVNVATVTNPEDPENPEEPEVPVTVTPDGVLGAEKLVDKASVKPEEKFEYTIVVKNLEEGSEPLTDIVVKDVLPEGLVFTDGIVYLNGVATDTVIEDNGFSVLIDEVVFGNDVKVSFEVQALKGEYGERVNIASVVNPEDPEHPEEPEVPVTITPLGKLSSEKLVSQSRVKVNEEFKYTIVVHNTEEHSHPLKDIVVKDTLPEGLEFTDGVIKINGVKSDVKVKGNSFELVLEEVHYGQEVSISFNVVALKEAHGTLVNIATVTNPEDPENPEEPEVPVTIVPEEPKEPEVPVTPSEPQDPEEPKEPKTPHTGIGSSNNVFMTMLMSALGLLVLLGKRKNEVNK